MTPEQSGAPKSRISIARAPEKTGFCQAYADTQERDAELLLERMAALHPVIPFWRLAVMLNCKAQRGEGGCCGD